MISGRHGIVVVSVDYVVSISLSSSDFLGEREKETFSYNMCSLQGFMPASNFAQPDKAFSDLDFQSTKLGPIILTRRTGWSVSAS